MSYKIVFKESDHSYRSEKGRYQSVSTLVGKFKQPFDKDHWSSYQALKILFGEADFKTMARGFNPADHGLIEYLMPFVDPDNFELVKQEILDGWAEKNRIAINKGNRYHASQEETALRRGTQINPFTDSIVNVQQAVNVKKEDGDEIRTPITSDLFKLEDGFYPELIIWNNDHMLCGQADKVFIETKSKNRYVYVDDWKTNKKIAKKNIYGKKMLPPMDHLDDCKYNHYRLQVSTYAWMLEQFGYKVKGTAFHHFNKMYDFKYMKKEVQLMLKSI